MVGEQEVNAVEGVLQRLVARELEASPEQHQAVDLCCSWLLRRKRFDEAVTVPYSPSKHSSLILTHSND